MEYPINKPLIVCAALRNPKGIRTNSETKGRGDCCLMDVLRGDGYLVISSLKIQFRKDSSSLEGRREVLNMGYRVSIR